MERGGGGDLEVKVQLIIITEGERGNSPKPGSGIDRAPDCQSQGGGDSGQRHRGWFWSRACAGWGLWEAEMQGEVGMVQSITSGAEVGRGGESGQEQTVGQGENGGEGLGALQIWG